MQPQYIPTGHRFKDITGQRFGRLITLGIAGRSKNGKILWHCRCDCGTERIVATSSLRSHNTTSCGCLLADINRARIRTHGLSDTRLYDVWHEMISRCINPARNVYESYGGRGITVCDDWQHDFQSFYDYVTQLPHFDDKGYSLDRIDNDLGYFPGNVRFATKTEQGRNKRNNHMITYNGETKCLAEWAKIVGMSPQTVLRRMKKGWTMERVFTTKVRPRRIR